MEQGTSDHGAAAVPAPVKLCECGCGNAAPIAKINHRKHGYVKGQPMKFIRGHYGRLPNVQYDLATVPAEVKLCECGCGKPTAIARQSDRSHGYIKGQQMRFVSGHHSPRGPKLNRRRLAVEAGQRFGRSIVIDSEVSLPDSRGPRRAARLRCDCGTEYVRLIRWIFRKPDAESCGCPGPDDLTGQRFGSLVVVQWAGGRPEGRKATTRWLCRCVCGNEVTLPSSKLINGHVRTCGCRHRNGPTEGYEYGEAAFNRLLRGYRRGAKTRGLAWDLDKDDFRRLTSLDCHYCGSAPAMVCESGQTNGVYVHNGLDRVDNTLGYTLDPPNVVPACKPCNHAKVDMSYDDFLAWIARVASFHFFRPDVTPPSLLRPPA